MKKLITLIITLLTFVTGTQVAHAEATETLEVTVESGMNFYDQNNFDVQLAFNALLYAGQVQLVPISDETTGVISTKTGKVLFSATNDGYIIVPADVTSEDDIYYIITDADRTAFEEADMADIMEQYAAIKMHLVPGDGNIGQAALIGTIKNGMNIEDSEYTWMALAALTQYFNQIKMEYELDIDGDFSGNIFYLSKDDKLLFILDKNNIITIADGVTSADNVVYTITQEDRDKLSEQDPEAFANFASYKTIELRFETSTSQTEDLAVTLRNGMNLTASENKDASLAVSVLMILHQIESNFDNELQLNAYSSATTGKRLFYMTEDSYIQIAQGLTPDDDIAYTITDADRKKLKGSTGEAMEAYGTIRLHFDTSGDVVPTQDFLVTIREGMDLTESKNFDVSNAINALETFGQLRKEYETILHYNTYFSTATGKALFILSYEHCIELMPDVTSADDITYTITESDREKLNDYYRELLKPYKTITLHINPVKEGLLGYQGTWRFENGVLTVDYIGAMPQNCTSKTTDPEVAYRLLWIDFLADIKEIVITGVDVEVQPYFLYYSGDGDLGQHPDDHIKTLTLGSGVKKVGKQAFATYDLKDVYCYGIEPPELSSDTGGSNVFWKKRIQENKAFLHLVQGASTGYARVNSEWSFFNHSATLLDPEDDPVGIKEIKNEELRIKNEGVWYSLDGRKLSGKPTQKGIYVNGGRKVVVK